MYRIITIAIFACVCFPAFAAKPEPDLRDVYSRGVAFAADACSRASPWSGEGVFPFDLNEATLDGPPHTACTFSRFDQIERDTWACWISPCTGKVFVRTCHWTDVDTKLAVYQGCTCPKVGGNLRACNDDGCGADSVQSLLAFDAVAGLRYLIRVGTFPGADPGSGFVEITCGTPNCPAGGPCLSGGTEPGCDERSCCEAVCSVDHFCCEDTWDAACADEAQGLCEGDFLTCGVGGDCSDPAGLETAGCADDECCNIVCRQDPFCCLRRWDDLCAVRAAVHCRRSCAASAASCFQPHAEPGCSRDDCCSEVCPRDPFCCQAEWDDTCVDTAKRHCR